MVVADSVARRLERALSRRSKAHATPLPSKPQLAGTGATIQIYRRLPRSRLRSCRPRSRLRSRLRLRTPCRRGASRDRDRDRDRRDHDHLDHGHLDDAIDDDIVDES